jgi:hypothetical protein
MSEKLSLRYHISPEQCGCNCKEQYDYDAIHTTSSDLTLRMSAVLELLAIVLDC